MMPNSLFFHKKPSCFGDKRMFLNVFCTKGNTYKIIKSTLHFNLAVLMLIDKHC